MRGFNKLSLTTLIAVYFLIWVGSTVRSTGSGMGCPDWPKCFGQWVPPTSIEQLPSDYKQSYSAYRDKKNQRFAKFLRKLGMNEVAEKIISDRSILTEADFNPLKTRIEYLNRLIGVVAGLLIAAIFVWSLFLIKRKVSIFWISLLASVVLLAQAWFGSIVVSTNLTTWTITIHMFMAMLLVALLAFLIVASDEKKEERRLLTSVPVRYILIACMGVLLIQTILGTQVRSVIDRLSAALIPRNDWIELIGVDFVLHRSFSWVVLLTHAVLIWKLNKSTGLKALRLGLIVLILLTLTTGIGMAYGGIPAFLQPIHLTLVAITFGTQLLLLFRLDTRQKEVLTS